MMSIITVKGFNLMPQSYDPEPASYEFPVEDNELTDENIAAVLTLAALYRVTSVSIKEKEEAE